MITSLTPVPYYCLRSIFFVSAVYGSCVVSQGSTFVYCYCSSMSQSMCNVDPVQCLVVTSDWHF